MDNADVRISNVSALDNPNISEEVKAHVVHQNIGDDQTDKQKDLSNIDAWSKE
jgi:hypothetical protein